MGIDPTGRRYPTPDPMSAGRALWEITSFACRLTLIIFLVSFPDWVLVHIGPYYTALLGHPSCECTCEPTP